LPHDLPDLRRRTLATACAGAVLLGVGAGAASAGAESSGGATADAGGKAPDAAVTPAPGGAGGSQKPAAGGDLVTAGPPKPLLITCRTVCSGLDVAQAGSTVRITGDAMAAARTVVFLGAKGGADDVSAPATAVAADAVDATVPAGATSGPITILDAVGSTSRTTGRTITIAAGDRAAKAAGAPAARVEVRKVFFRGAHRATLSVFVPGTESRHVAVDLLRDTDRKPVGHWELDVPGSTVQSVSWSGVVNGTVQRSGTYRFQVSAPLPGAVAAQSDTVASAFTFLADQFPIRGRHDLGGGSSGVFGAGRGGRGHQGQDVFAACGTRLVAARGGKVKFRGFQPAAGNSIVIDAAGTGVDYGTCTSSSPPSSRRAPPSPPDSRSARSGTPGTRSGAICTSSSGPPRAGTRAGRRSTRCRR
jgi:murein DD-endopeptidase MepM/ murein hydrolase activator NlpD